MTAERARTRAELLPEEEQAGSDDPDAQAEQILAESDERSRRPEKDEHRTSNEATPPPDAPVS
jgi:cell division septum initiation protein DivIVA